jgi:uncharacterized membrane protein
MMADPLGSVTVGWLIVQEMAKRFYAKFHYIEEDE